MAGFLVWMLPLEVPMYHPSDLSPRVDFLPFQEPICEAVIELDVKRVHTVLSRLELEKEFEKPLCPLSFLCDSVKFTFLSK